jgi:hypothetical protein
MMSVRLWIGRARCPGCGRVVPRRLDGRFRVHRPDGVTPCPGRAQDGA